MTCQAKGSGLASHVMISFHGMIRVPNRYLSHCHICSQATIGRTPV